jgi:hypothetical protein
MDSTRFDTLTRTLRRTPSRRAALRTTLGGLTVAALGRLSAAPARSAKKKTRKKKCPDCPNCPTCPPALTCQQTCPDVCGFCWVRPGTTTLCGQAGLVDCDQPCASDADCPNAGRRFCVSQLINRATGEVVDNCPTPGGFCSSSPSC